MRTERPPHTICVVGAGPRGLSVLERLCANERARPSHHAVTIHLVDPAMTGSGAVWRCDQSRHLLTNTVASQITVYTDPSSRIDGPVEPGPSLYDWARSLALSPARPEHEPQARTGHDEATLAEARTLGPDDYPTRAFYGRYLHDAFRRIVARAPEHVSVKVHPSRAVAIADTHGVPGGPQGIRLLDGTRLHDLDAVVLALGHVPARLSAREARTASLARIHNLTYITPANPADLEEELSLIRPGETVLLRGLGLNFFDHMALLTVGRGGAFVRDEDGRLSYLASGEEPVLYASSRRGVPYHSRGENQKGVYGRHLPRLLTPGHIARLRGRAASGPPVNFTTDLWPLVSREVESVYYAALLAQRGRGAEEVEAFTSAYLATPVVIPGSEPGEPSRPGAAGRSTTGAVLDRYGIEPEVRWDWERLSKPYGDRVFTGRDDFHGWLLDHLTRDVAEARAGNVEGPLKAALDVLRDLRNEIRLAVDHGGLDGNSHRDDLEGWYTPLNAFLSIGPPAERIEQMIALIEAGVLTVTGPGTRIRLHVTAPAFVADSTVVPGPPVRARVLIEARLPEPDLRRTEDPLLQHMLNTDQAAPYRIPAARGEAYETGGLAVTPRPYRLIDGRGHAHPRRFAYGVPTESVHWVTAAGIRPGVDSVTLADSDAIARAALALPGVSRVPADVRRPGRLDVDATAGPGSGGDIGSDLEQNGVIV